MKHSQLAIIIKKRYAKIDGALNKIINNFDTNDIHKFRLEAKRLRSFLRLVSTGKRKRYKGKLPKKLHDFYSSIGAIRNLQIQHSTIEELGNQEYSVVTKPYLAYIHHEIDAQIRQVRNLVKGKRPFSKGRKEIIKHLPSKLKFKSIRKFTSNELRTLSNLMKPSSLTDESLHVVRKTLKDILYTWNYTNEKTNIPSVAVMGKKEIRSITTILGRFQDKCVGLDLLHKHYKKQLTNLNERLLWRKLENLLWTEKERARENIHKVFQKEFHLPIDLVHGNDNHYLPLAK